MRRLSRFGVYALVAIILCLTPAAMWADMVSNWGYDGHPRYADREAVAFRTLVLPVAFATKALGLRQTGYGVVALISARLEAPSIESGVPGFHTLRFLQIALPFWLVVVSAAGELLRLAQRRSHGSAG